MPVRAKLSKLFYDRFGEALANELLEFVDQVDATSRVELRELNETNFARFDAKLEQRIAETNARMDVGFAALRAELRTLEASIHKEMKLQTRFLYLGWAVQLAAIVALLAR